MSLFILQLGYDYFNESVLFLGLDSKSYKLNFWTCFSARLWNSKTYKMRNFRYMFCLFIGDSLTLFISVGERFSIIFYFVVYTWCRWIGTIHQLLQAANESCLICVCFLWTHGNAEVPVLPIQPIFCLCFGKLVLLLFVLL